MEIDEEEHSYENKRNKFIRLFIAVFLILLMVVGYLGLMRHT